MIYYGVIKSIYFSKHCIRDVLLYSDYAFHQDPDSGHWKFLKYRHTSEGLKVEFFTVSDLLDYLYKDLSTFSVKFERSELNIIKKMPERKDPFDPHIQEVISDFNYMRDHFIKNMKLGGDYD